MGFIRKMERSKVKKQVGSNRIAYAWHNHQTGKYGYEFYALLRKFGYYVATIIKELNTRKTTLK